jgi:hypothetical protein
MIQETEEEFLAGVVIYACEGAYGDIFPYVYSSIVNLARFNDVEMDRVFFLKQHHRLFEPLQGDVNE